MTEPDDDPQQRKRGQSRRTPVKTKYRIHLDRTSKTTISTAREAYAEAEQPSAPSDDGVWETVSDLFQETEAKLRALQDTLDELELRARGVVRHGIR